jgi:hypothetical protein
MQTAATQLGQQATVLEKDIWVCWALQALFSMPDAHPMAFKGGTSLSKIYGVINRFSEDVDVTLDYRAFDDEFDPFAEGVSNTAIKKFSKRLKGYVHKYASDVVTPYIDAQLKTLPRPEEYGIEVSDDGEKIWVQYPSAIEGGDDYLKSSILIELGGRNVIDPNERHTVKPDISALVTDLDLPSGEVVVLSPVRYMDDIVWWGNDKNEVRQVLQQVQAYLAEQRRLTIKPSWRLQRSNQGIGFCGDCAGKGVVCGDSVLPFFKVWPIATRPRSRIWQCYSAAKTSSE